MIKVTTEISSLGKSINRTNWKKNTFSLLRFLVYQDGFSGELWDRNFFWLKQFFHALCLPTGASWKLSKFFLHVRISSTSFSIEEIFSTFFSGCRRFSLVYMKVERQQKFIKMLSGSIQNFFINIDSNNNSQTKNESRSRRKKLKNLLNQIH